MVAHMTEVTITIGSYPEQAGGTLTRFQLVVERLPDRKSSGTVPAAESTLLRTLCCQLARADARLLQDMAVDGVAGSGWCAVSAVPTHSGYEYVRGAFELAVMGFCLLAEQFPRQVCVRLETEEQCA